MKYTALSYHNFKPFYPPYAKLNLYPYIFSHFKKVSFLSFTKQITFCGTNYDLCT